MSTTRFKIQHIGADGKTGFIAYSSLEKAYHLFTGEAVRRNVPFCTMKLRSVLNGQTAEYITSSPIATITIESYEVTNQPSSFGLSSRS